MAIVLVFEDSLPVTFPHSTAAAAKVITTYGSVFAKDLVYNHAMQIIQKDDNVAANASAYTYARTSDGNVSEFARQTFSLDAGLTTGAYSLQCLRKNGTTTTIDRALDVDHTQMVISSTSPSDAALASTCAINYNGIQFGTDAASIYFGSNLNFRIIFGNADAPGGGNTLSIQAKQTDGSYSNAVQYTDRTG